MTLTIERTYKPGQSIRTLREALGLSMGDMARRLQVSTVWVSDVERSKRIVDIETLRSILHNLAVPFGHHIRDSDSNTKRKKP